MAENEQTSDEAVATAEEENVIELPIERERSFVRITADIAIVINRPQDLELSLLAQGPDPAVQLASEISDGKYSVREVTMQASYWELARIRMSPPAALTMAMQIVETHMANGRVNLPAFRQAVDSLFDQYAPAPSADEETEAS